MTNNPIVNRKDPFGLTEYFGKTVGDFFGSDFFRNEYPLKEGIANYPPYNVVRSEDGKKYTISLAMAGLDKDDIDVTVSNNKLTISYEGTEKEEEENQTFIYQGIAKRSFKKIFPIPKNAEVTDCSLTNGMLSITIEKDESNYDDFKRIEIN